MYILQHIYTYTQRINHHYHRIISLPLIMLHLPTQLFSLLSLSKHNENPPPLSHRHIITGHRSSDWISRLIDYASTVLFYFYSQRPESNELAGSSSDVTVEIRIQIRFGQRARTIKSWIRVLEAILADRARGLNRRWRRFRFYCRSVRRRNC